MPTVRTNALAAARVLKAHKEAEWQAQEEVAAPKAKVEAESLAHEEEKRQAQEEAAPSRPKKRLRRAGRVSEAQGIMGV